MNSNLLHLDAKVAEEKFATFNKLFPQQRLQDYYRFNDEISTDENLANLSLSSLKGEYTIAHLFIYKNLFLDCCSRWIFQEESEHFVSILNALGRIITLFPESSQLAEHFLIKNNDFLNAILQTYQSQCAEDLETILLSYYRFIYHDRIRFEKYLRPETLNNLLNNDSNLVRFLAVKILSLYLEMAESAYEIVLNKYINMESETVLGCYEGCKGIDFQFLELNEAKRFSNYHNLPVDMIELISLADGQRDISGCIPIDSTQLSSHVVEVCGVLVPRILDSKYKPKTAQSNIVYTENAKDVLKKLAGCIQSNKPVMVIGKAGSGKTFLINELSKFLNCDDRLVKIHLGEQTDAKLLLGTYTSGEKPGTFEWRSGVLTTAVKEGRWVLIEDIDKAPTEVLSVLLTLLEKREISIPSRGEIIKASNGFQLISTITVDEDKKGETGYKPDLIGMRLWETVLVHDSSELELKQILSKRFHILTALIPKLIKTFNSVKEIYRNPQFVSLNKGIHPRVVSVRDLVKLCQRIAALFERNNISKPDQLIETTIYDDVFSEAVDCFVGSISEHKAIEPLVQAIGQSLEISNSRISLFLSKHVPKFEDNGTEIQIGRAKLSKTKFSVMKKSANSTSFARTNHSLRLMEQIGVAVQMCEPVLLVGETGTGKTTVVQQVAKLMNKSLTVINVSQQTESGDLLGGYKPVNCRTVAIPILEEFEGLFASTFSLKKNEKFYKLFHRCFSKGQWKNVVRLWKEAVKMANTVLKVAKDEATDDSKKKKRKLDSESKILLLQKWTQFEKDVNSFELQSSSIENAFVFNFVEGSLVKAVRNGEWLLLDEVNLASADTLENIADLLSEESSRSILLSEKGEAEAIKAHKDFRIFACMNPATDVGKRDLPTGIRSRFTEIYVHSPDRDVTDLLSIIDKYISKYSVSDEWVGNDIAELYLEAKRLAEANKIVDGSNQRPHFSIRTLTRTLLYVTDIVHIYGLRRSLYEGFCMAFLTLLDTKSEELLRKLIEKFTLGRLKNFKSVMSQTPSSPGSDYVQFRHYWMKSGPSEIKEQAHYIITPFVEKNLLNLVRATSGKRFPVLIQGPTSAGKTSMIKYLADITGHKFVRINNHEHTDLQEYLGTYSTDENGKLTFREGVLVEALRKGHWIVLDELNLAPTDVLEALNRLLDDNRELFIPETQEIIHPHPDFMLFATQNPPGIYGGRKVLSRAFRNRFLELHFDDIPQDELEVILKQRCQIAPSYAKKIVEVYRQLSIQRSANRLFEQKNSFATLRDLFRWAFRPAVGYEQLAANGYMLLAERCRSSEEKSVVQAVLEKVMKVKLDMDLYYSSLEDPGLTTIESSIVWTKAMRKLAVLVSTCLQNNEPVLLVGETGCGKTTICQLIAQYGSKNLITINAHQNTETGDILGAQRPVRNRSQLQSVLTSTLRALLDDVEEDATLDELLSVYDRLPKETIPADTQESIASLRDALKVLFEWCDGPLVKAMKSGDFFLLDEISLADDSVLERLNSVLEPERSLLLAEKGSFDSYITAANGFQFFATMNPGGDYGKKELSPALKNRFTEIWVPSMEDFNDVSVIVNNKLRENVKYLTEAIVNFSEWYGKKFGGGKANNGVISLRDILAWVDFINSTTTTIEDYNACMFHGAAMVFIDALGTNNTAHLAANEKLLHQQKVECINQLSLFMNQDLTKYFEASAEVSLTQTHLKSGVFVLKRNENMRTSVEFNLHAPTTSNNLMRVIRALQVKKPILLEGSPGVGKTSLISALADYTGNKLTRINLSEQTDLVDLFGFDAPGEKTGEFVWRDAPFLRAMQKGEWVLLDEMNLASQSVLEGLNACLDHRGEAYIPELDRVFTRHPNFLVFAAQNPQYQGGGRKGLPKSFVNRFSVVYVDMLTPQDLLMIATHIYPNIEPEVCRKMIKMMSTLEEDVSNKKLWGIAGSPWEFNLRDTLRWLQLLNSASICEDINVADFLEIIIKQRFRTIDDRSKASSLIEEIFGPTEKRDDYFYLTNTYLQINAALMSRNDTVQYSSSNHLVALQCNYSIYESIMRCIKLNWPMILVGPTNSGKTEMIKFIASIIGRKTVEFSMNSDVDSMDILGGYEQLDLTRKISGIVDRLVEVLRLLLIVNISSTLLPEAISSAFVLFDFLSNNLVSRLNFDEFFNLFNRLFDFANYNQDLIQVKADIEKMKQLIEKENSVKFEWFDGLLVKAVEAGHWLILDNANLCSPSVLDRINSLLETNGSLIINECSLSDGQPRIVKPHPDFRLFLTMDPKYGELSRAMRNRGIEVFVEDLHARATVQDQKLLGYEIPIKEEPIESKLSSMQLNHANVAAKPLSGFISPRISQLTSFVRIHDMLLLDTVSPAVVSTIPFTLIRMVSAWKDNTIRTGLYEDVDTVVKMEECISALYTGNILPEFHKLYETLQPVADKLLKVPNNFTDSQSLMPTSNSYITASLRRNSPNSVTSEPVFFFELSSLLIDSAKKMDFAARKSIHGKVNELTYLEQSAACHLGKNIKNPPNIPIFNLLSRLNQYLLDSLHHMPLFSKQDIYKSYFALYVIWIGAYSTSVMRDEAKLRVYQELLQKWISSMNGMGEDLIEVTNIAEEFGRSLKLSTGTSMFVLWEEFRNTYPSSLELWNRMDELHLVAKNFDSMVSRQFSDSYEFVNQLQDTFITLKSNLLSGDISDFDVILSKINEGIENLNEISSSFLIKRKNYFKEEFTSLMRLLFQDIAVTQKYISDIASNADISTVTLMALKSKHIVYPSVFDLLWKYENGKYHSHVKSIVTPCLIENVILKSNKFKDFSGGLIQQSLSDAKKLVKSLVDSSKFILTDQHVVYSKILFKWIVDIVAVHTKLESNYLSKLAIEEITKKVNESNDTAWKDIYNNFLGPSLYLIESDNNLQTLGKAWVLFAVGLLQLFVPSSPYDPAIHDYVVYDTFLTHQSLTEGLIKTWKTVGSVITGDEPTATERMIPQVDKELAPKKPKVFRPDRSIDGLFEEWSAFMTSTVDIKPIEALLNSALTASSMSSNQLKMFEQNTSQFLSRLSSTYRHYSDINEIFTGYVYSMKFGFNLINIANEDNSKDIETPPLFAVDCLTITNSVEVSKAFTKLNPYFKNKNVDSLSVERVLTFFLSLCKLHKGESIMSITLNDILQPLYYRWSLRRMKEEQKAQQDGSMFKFKDESEDIESEFKSMFPDYEDNISMDSEIMDKTEMSLDDAYYEIAKKYMEIFGDENEISLSTILQEGSEVAGVLLENSNEFRNYKITDSLLLAAVNRVSQEISSFNQESNKKELDFYRGHSMVESRRAMLVIEKLWNTINDLLKQWPEHATLQELNRICEEFMNYASSTPIARLLQKLEQIYTFMTEWEKYASSKVSLGSHVHEITSLIVSWRRLELHTWKSLFEYEEFNSSKSTGKWWFYLFETIILGSMNESEPENQHSYTSLISSLNIFFSKSTYGEFTNRLQLVKAFGKHVRLLKLENNLISQALDNVVTFYEQFSPIVKENISMRKKMLEKEMSEIILLASWKDVNIDALKQSSRKSHNNLYKLVRKYRTLLSEPLVNIIETGLDPSQSILHKFEPVSSPYARFIDLSKTQAIVVTIPSWDSRSKALKNIELVEKNMSVYTLKITSQAYPDLLQYAKEISAESKRLREETPKVYTKDKKKLLATLKTQKRKLLSDTIKELKRIGLKSNYREDIQKVQASVISVLSNSKSLAGTPIEFCDGYFFRILDLLPRLKNAVSSPADDIPSYDIDKGMAMAENLIFSLIATREPLNKLASYYMELDSLRLDLENIALDSTELKHSSLSFSMSSLAVICKWLPNLIDYAIYSLNSTGSKSQGALISYLSAAKDKFLHFQSMSNQFRVYNNETEELLKQAKSFIRSFTNYLISDTNEKYIFVLRPLVSWIHNQTQSDAVLDVKHEIVSVEIVDEKLRSIHTTIMLSVQSLIEQQSDQLTEDNDKWFTESNKTIFRNIKLLRANKITNMLSNFVDMIKSTSFSELDSGKVSAAISFTLPVINHYFSMLNGILNTASENYYKTSKSTFIFSTILYNLAKDGLCSPEPPSEEVNDNNLQEGTGLGDGEGADNNSKDVEEDEDLLEDAQNPNKDQKEEDDENENEEDAIDMEGDIAGDLENASDQEKDDDDDEAEEEEEDLDEQIDNLDEDDPNALDEKMWDEEAKDDSKEKESENMPENSANDDVQASEEQNENQEQDQNSKQDQEGNENEEDNAEEDDDAEMEEDVGEQEDEVRNNENEELEANIPEVETMELPEDMNLDSGDDDKEEQKSDEEDIEDEMDLDEEDEEEGKSNEAKNENEVDKEEDSNAEDEDVHMEAGENDDEEEEDEDNEQPTEEAETNADENKDMDENMQSEDELNENEEKESKEKGGEDENNDDIEGLDGVEDIANEQSDVNTDAAVQQDSGTKGDGADTADTEEQQDVGSSGTAQAQQEDNSDDQITEASRKEAQESLKQLGDSLKEFHRRHQEIKDASSNTEEEQESKANERPDEFEHVDGANTETDTQALGSADKDQITGFDENMAIDDENDLEEIAEEKQEDLKEELNSNSEEIKNEEENRSGDFDKDENNGKSQGAFIGERNMVEDQETVLNHEISQTNENDIDELLTEIDQEVQQESLNVAPPRSSEEARNLWRTSELETAELAAGLSEQLRLILEPTLATKLRGDYKTGKRLNMKRIIPYIASQYRKDKIWLRRTKPSKREYQIMIAVDDSKSMSESKSVRLAFQSICLVSKALTQLESGGLSIVKFGETTREVHRFDQQFNNDSGVKAFQWFDFQETKTDVKKLVAESLKIFERARSRHNNDLWQLEIIISDGVCEDHETLVRLVRRARENKIMLVFVIIDGINSNESIMDMSQVKYLPDQFGNLQLSVEKYLDTFPFEFYVVVHDISELPEMISLILRQYFSEMASY